MDAPLQRRKRRPAPAARRPWRRMLTATLLGVLAFTTGCRGDRQDEASPRPAAQSESRDEPVVAVPVLKGVAGTKARCRLVELGLRYRYVGSRRTISGASEDYCEGRASRIPDPSIVAQRPRAGTRVRKGSVIVLRDSCYRKLCL